MQGKGWDIPIIKKSVASVVSAVSAVKKKPKAVPAPVVVVEEESEEDEMSFEIEPSKSKSKPKAAPLAMVKSTTTTSSAKPKPSSMATTTTTKTTPSKSKSASTVPDEPTDKFSTAISNIFNHIKVNEVAFHYLGPNITRMDYSKSILPGRRIPQTRVRDYKGFPYRTDTELFAGTFFDVPEEKRAMFGERGHGTVFEDSGHKYGIVRDGVVYTKGITSGTSMKQILTLFCKWKKTAFVEFSEYLYHEYYMADRMSTDYPDYLPEYKKDKMDRLKEREEKRLSNMEKLGFAPGSLPAKEVITADSFRVLRSRDISDDDGDYGEFASRFLKDDDDDEGATPLSEDASGGQKGTALHGAIDRMLRSKRDQLEPLIGMQPEIDQFMNAFKMFHGHKFFHNEANIPHAMGDVLSEVKFSTTGFMGCGAIDAMHYDNVNFIHWLLDWKSGTSKDTIRDADIGEWETGDTKALFLPYKDENDKLFTFNGIPGVSLYPALVLNPQHLFPRSDIWVQRLMQASAYRTLCSQNDVATSRYKIIVGLSKEFESSMFNKPSNEHDDMDRRLPRFVILDTEAPLMEYILKAEKATKKREGSPPIPVIGPNSQQITAFCTYHMQLALEKFVGLRPGFKSNRPDALILDESDLYEDTRKGEGDDGDGDVPIRDKLVKRVVADIKMREGEEADEHAKKSMSAKFPKQFGGQLGSFVFTDDTVKIVDELVEAERALEKKREEERIEREEQERKRMKPSTPSPPPSPRVFAGNQPVLGGSQPVDEGDDKTTDDGKGDNYDVDMAEAAQRSESEMASQIIEEEFPTAGQPADWDMSDEQIREETERLGREREAENAKRLAKEAEDERKEQEARDRRHSMVANESPDVQVTPLFAGKSRMPSTFNTPIEASQTIDDLMDARTQLETEIEKRAIIYNAFLDYMYELTEQNEKYGPSKRADVKYTYIKEEDVAGIAKDEFTRIGQKYIGPDFNKRLKHEIETYQKRRN